MKILNVINVGQGDSMIIRPPEDCTHRNRDIYVDLGPGGTDVARYMRAEHEVSIFITHHDSDHLNGIRYFINNFDNVSELILPFYQDEISLIARAILNLKSINSARNCHHFIRLFNDIVNNQNFLSDVSWGGKIHLRFAYEGMRYCDHIQVLNPPIVPQCKDWLEDVAVNEFEEVFSELFNKEFAQDLLHYVVYSKRGIQDEDPISRKFIRTHNEEFQNSDRFREVLQKKSNVVLDFVMRNAKLFRSFNATPTQGNMSKVYKKYINCTHDRCTVLKLSYVDKTFLLTADASKKVFNRLIKQRVFDLKSDYLKVPHHGSKNNMSEKILDAIQPRVAIISHNNGLFGRAADPHPNAEVLKFLNDRNIDILVTNDVIKNNVTVIAKRDNKPDRYVDII